MKTKKKFMWNVLCIPIPPMRFVTVSSKLKLYIKKAFHSEYSVNDRRDILFLEIAMLHRFMFQRRNKYRSDRGFKTLEKVCKSLVNLHKLDITSIISLMENSVVDSFVPSKQNIQWLLVKYQSYAKLLERIIKCSFASGVSLHHRLQTGHAWSEVSVAIAMISRIWRISKHLLDVSCDMFKKLSHLLHKDKIPQSEGTPSPSWLPSQYSIPLSLREWLENKEENENKWWTENENEQIISEDHMKKFLQREKNLRRKGMKKGRTKKFDAFQWHMFAKEMSSYWKKLKKETRSDAKSDLLRDINHRIRLWLH